MQESGATAASDREGGQGKVGRENSETSTVTGIRARHARIGATAASDREGVQGKTQNRRGVSFMFCKLVQV
jgi:hypothetical protein